MRGGESFEPRAHGSLTTKVTEGQGAQGFRAQELLLGIRNPNLCLGGFRFGPAFAETLDQ
jgi:hypothetical protein